MASNKERKSRYKLVVIYLTHDVIETLDNEAEEQHKTRSGLVRDIINNHLRKQKK